MLAKKVFSNLNFMRRVIHLYVDLINNPMGRIKRSDLIIVFFTTFFLLVFNQLIFWDYPGNAFVYLLINLTWIVFCIKRIHDAGWSGWWVIVPVLNLYLTFFKKSDDENKWGPNKS